MWDTFISTKIYNDKEKNMAGVELFKKIEQVEDELKRNFDLDKSNEIQLMYENLKIIDAQKISLEILYAKLKVFDYRDEPGKHLVQILLGPSAKVKVGPLKKWVGKVKSNTAPSPDGFTIEFYKTFAAQLSPILQELFQECLFGQTCPPSWTLANIILLPKQDSDPSLPGSYRPISLLNADYKIWTTILATRLNRIIAQCIHRDHWVHLWMSDAR